MSYIPKYIIKRMFPKDKCLEIVKKDGEDWVMLTMVNVISPITVPDGKIDLGNVNLPADIGKYIKIKVNGMDVPATPQILLNDVMLYSGGKGHTWKSIFEENSASGVTIPVGGKLALLLRKKAFPKNVVDAMKPNTDVEVSVDVSIDNPMNLTAMATLRDTGAAFDPKNT